MTDEPDDTVMPDGYELAMPFLVVTSKGGPYDDVAFVAGWRCAELDRDLATAARIGAASLTRTLEPALLPQADLLAMTHGLLGPVAAVGRGTGRLARRGVHGRR